MISVFDAISTRVFIIDSDFLGCLEIAIETELGPLLLLSALSTNEPVPPELCEYALPFITSFLDPQSPATAYRALVSLLSMCRTGFEISDGYLNAAIEPFLGPVALCLHEILPYLMSFLGDPGHYSEWQFFVH
jgi:hypothetical protein